MANMVCDLPGRCINIKIPCADCEHYKALYDPKIYKLVPIGEESEPCKDAEPCTRQYVLKEAEKCVCGQREQDYGGPEDSFRLIAELWEPYIRERLVSKGADASIEPHDVAVMMGLLKVARIASNPQHMDSWVDGCGYFSCGGEIVGGDKHENYT